MKGTLLLGSMNNQSTQFKGLELNWEYNMASRLLAGAKFPRAHPLDLRKIRDYS